MQKQQLCNEDVNTGMERDSRRQTYMATYVEDGRIKANEALCAEHAVEKVSIWQAVRSFGMTANFPGSRWFLDLYFFNSQKKCMLF